MAFNIERFNRSWAAGGVVGTAGSDMSLPVTLNSISLPSMQYLFVALVNGLVLPVSASGSAYKDLAVGILVNRPAPNQEATVAIDGVAKVHSNDSTIVPGTVLYCDQYGMAVSSAGGTHSTHAVGIAEESAASSGGYVISVLLKPMGALA